MRNNRRARPINEELETKKLIYISVAVIIIAILAFVITYIAYSKVLSNDYETGDIKAKITELSLAQNEQSSEASSSIGKNVNEMKNEEDSTKIAINTTNIEKQNETQETKEDSKKENEVTALPKEEKKENTQNIQTVTKEVEKKADPTFIKPVDGEIIVEYANENLVYSNTLKEWITHNGIDIKAEKASIVKAASDGKVKFIKNDPRYGITVAIEHDNGYVSIYANLLTAEFVKEEEKVKQGQTIGTIGNTAVFEIADEPHLHFEILKEDKNLNPSEYIK